MFSSPASFVIPFKFSDSLLVVNIDEKTFFPLSSLGARKLSFLRYSYCKDRLDPKTAKCYWKQTANNLHRSDLPQIEVQQSMAGNKIPLDRP